jgi:hypothetical protein
MERDFDICPHCAAHGRHRVIRPATPQRTPLVSRSDGCTFHIFLEESNISHTPPGAVNTAALFRYDLDPVAIRGESVLVVIKSTGALGEAAGMVGLHKAADVMAELLRRGEVPSRYCELLPTGELVQHQRAS